MTLSELGIIADIFWHEIPTHSKFVSLGEFVVMPNHIHGIILIDKPETVPEIKPTHSAQTAAKSTATGPTAPVDTRHALYQLSQTSPPSQTPPPSRTSPPSQTPPTPIPGKTRFQNQGKNTISSIVGSYKSAVTKHANRLGLANGWQSGFYDNIIRSRPDYIRIENYILNNPSKWQQDKFYGNT